MTNLVTRLGRALADVDLDALRDVLDAPGDAERTQLLAVLAEVDREQDTDALRARLEKQRRVIDLLSRRPTLGPEPVEMWFGARWIGRSGWTVTVNRHGDLYVSDSKFPADEVGEFAVAVDDAMMRSAREVAERASEEGS